MGKIKMNGNNENNEKDTENEIIEKYYGEYVLGEDGFLYYTRDDIIKKHRNFVKTMLKSIGKKLFTLGKDIM